MDLDEPEVFPALVFDMSKTTVVNLGGPVSRFARASGLRV